MHKAWNEHWLFPPLQEVAHVFMRNWGHTSRDVFISLLHEYTWPEVSLSSCFLDCKWAWAKLHRLDPPNLAQVWGPVRRRPQGALVRSQPCPQLQEGDSGSCRMDGETHPNTVTTRGLEDRRELSPSSISAELSLLWATWVHCNKTAMSRSKVRIGLPPQEKNVIGGKHEKQIKYNYFRHNWISKKGNKK